MISDHEWPVPPCLAAVQTPIYRSTYPYLNCSSLAYIATMITAMRSYCTIHDPYSWAGQSNNSNSIGPWSVVDPFTSFGSNLSTTFWGRLSCAAVLHRQTDMITVPRSLSSTSLELGEGKYTRLLLNSDFRPLGLLPPVYFTKCQRENNFCNSNMVHH